MEPQLEMLTKITHVPEKCQLQDAAISLGLQFDFCIYVCASATFLDTSGYGTHRLYAMQNPLRLTHLNTFFSPSRKF